MEWLLALIATGFSASIAVHFSYSKAERRRWLLEITRAFALANPSGADRYLFTDLKRYEAEIEALRKEQEEIAPRKLAA